MKFYDLELKKDAFAWLYENTLRASSIPIWGRNEKFNSRCNMTRPSLYAFVYFSLIAYNALPIRLVLLFNKIVSWSKWKHRYLNDRRQLAFATKAPRIVLDTGYSIKVFDSRIFQLLIGAVICNQSSFTWVKGLIDLVKIFLRQTRQYDFKKGIFQIDVEDIFEYCELSVYRIENGTHLRSTQFFRQKTQFITDF